MRSLLEARSRERWYNPRQFACKPRVIPPLGARWPGQSESTTGIGIEGASKDISHKVRTGILSYMNPLKISENHKIKIEWLMFCMFNCCALPWSFMDCRFFIAFIHVLAPNFTVPDWSAFFPKHLVQEFAVWGKKLKAFLERKSHLTMSLNG